MELRPAPRPTRGRSSRRLAVFHGTFSLEAAESVAGADLDLLERLVDASLMKPIGESRFLLLETIREFAGSRLGETERAALAARHAAYFLELAESLAPGLPAPTARRCSPGSAPTTGTCARRSTRSSRPRSSPPDVGAVALLARARPLPRGADADRGRAGAPVDDARRADLLYQLGAILISRGRSVEGETACEQGARALPRGGNERGGAKALMALGHSTGDRGEWERARTYYEQALVLCRETARSSTSPACSATSPASSSTSARPTRRCRSRPSRSRCSGASDSSRASRSCRRRRRTPTS